MLKDFSKEKFDIIIQAGQSNSEGYGVGNVEEPYWPSDLVWYLTDKLTIIPATEIAIANDIQSNYSLSFARRYLEEGFLAEDRKILILRAGVGSTGFLSGHWTENGECYLKMLEMCRLALSLNSENRIKALLWHQGENDVSDKATYDIHFKNLSRFLALVRETVATPNLPFIAGDFVHHWKNENIEKATPISNAIEDFCNNDAASKFVKTDGLKSNKEENGRKTPCGKEMIEDIIHFSRPSLYILGERYFEAYKSVLKENVKSR
jgi:hypothetical protein